MLQASVASPKQRHRLLHQSKQLCTKDPGPATVGGVATGASRIFLSQGCLPSSLYGSSAYGTVNTAGTLTGLLGNIFGFTSGDVNAGNTTSTDLQSNYLLRQIAY